MGKWRRWWEWEVRSIRGTRTSTRVLGELPLTIIFALQRRVQLGPPTLASLDLHSKLKAPYRTLTRGADIPKIGALLSIRCQIPSILVSGFEVCLWNSFYVYSNMRHYMIYPRTSLSPKALPAGPLSTSAIRQARQIFPKFAVNGDASRYPINPYGGIYLARTQL